MVEPENVVTFLEKNSHLGELVLVPKQLETGV